MLVHGASVAVADPAHIPERLIPFEADGTLYHVNCDVSDTLSIRNMFKQTCSLFGSIDILVNNAVYRAGYGRSEMDEMSDDIWNIGMDGTAGTVFQRNLAEKTRLKRVGRQHEVAGAAVFLASPASSYITGANIPVDTGKAGI